MKLIQWVIPVIFFFSGFPPHQAGEEGISVDVSGQRDELGWPETILSCRSVQFYKKLTLIENKAKRG